nr:MAG TPA: hypothetical protein [Caudoviricetes sp.]
MALTGKSNRTTRPRYVCDWNAATVPGMTAGETAHCTLRVLI